MILRIAGLTSLALAAAGAGRADMPSVPELAVPVCAAPPVVDGSLTDACWRTAARVDAFHRANGPLPSEPRRHRAMAVRDAAWLYVGFEVDQPVAQRDPPLYVGHDSTVQREDNVQVSFDPGTDGAVFYQFLVNKANTRADFRMTRAAGREREAWNIPWKSAVRAEPLGWTAELALPLCLLAEHGDPARARLNLIVDTFRVQRDPQHVKTGVDREFLSWAPLEGREPADAWNAPERFGRLVGFDLAGLTAPLLPTLGAVECGRYYTTNGALHYDLNADLVLFSSASGAVSLAVADTPVGGEPRVTEHVFPVDGRAMRLTARVPVPVAEMAERRTVLRLLDPATREVWQEWALEAGAAQRLVSAFWDRDYYTHEPNAAALCRIALADDVRRTMTLAACLDGATLAAQDAPPADARLAVPLEALPAGVHAVRLELRGPDGVPVSSTVLDLVKRAPRPGCEWKVDRIHGRLLDNGAPFFPFGMVIGIKPADDYAFAEMAAAGFNTLQQWSYAPEGDRSDPDGAQVADIRAYLEAAARHGLKVIAAPDMNYVPFNDRTRVRDPGGLLTPAELEAVNRELDSETCSLGLGVKGMVLSAIPGRDARTKAAIISEYFDNQRPYLVPVIREAARHPALAGFFLFDEPFLNPEFGQLPAARAAYRLVKDTDGYHPVFVNCTPHIQQFPDEWFDWMDMLGTDPYWTPGWTGERGSIAYVAWMAYHTARKARRLRQVPMVVLMGAEYSGARIRALTPVEQMCQTYLALIHGARGILYFSYPVRAQANWDTLRELARRMQRLGPVCLEPDLPGDLTYSGGPYDFEANRLPDVHVALKRDPQGGFVLLAANAIARPVAITCTASPLVGGGAVRELFSGQPYGIEAGAFKDTLEPLGVRAYRLEPRTEHAPAAPIRVAVDMAPQGPEPAQPAADPTGRRGMKNLLPNPSLEEATVPGRPDYWRQTGASLNPWERTGGSNQVWGLTSESPYHGERCLVMTSSNGAGRIVYWSQEFAHRAVEQYVFSVWLRADRDRAPVFLHAGKESRAVTVSREWARYSLPFSAGARRVMLMVRFHGDAGASAAPASLWCDAFQLEAGKTPTEFEP